MLASAQPFPSTAQSVPAIFTPRPALPRGFRYDQGAYDQEVIADSTGRIVAGDPGQSSVDQWLVQKGLVPLQGSSQSSLSPNYATLAVLAVVAFIALGGRR
jgi:hypothetical protein